MRLTTLHFKNELVQTQYYTKNLVRRESNPEPLGWQPGTLTTRPQRRSERYYRKCKTILKRNTLTILLVELILVPWCIELLNLFVINHRLITLQANYDNQIFSVHFKRIIFNWKRIITECLSFVDLLKAVSINAFSLLTFWQNVSR
jgi:hypothetical protein